MNAHLGMLVFFCFGLLVVDQAAAQTPTPNAADNKALTFLQQDAWTSADLQRAASAEPDGELFRRSVRAEDAYEIDESFIVSRGCEQAWAMTTAEDPAQLSALFGDTIAVFRREETFDDGYRAAMAESILGFTRETRQTRWTFDEGDPHHRTGEMRTLDTEDPTWVRYQLVSVGDPNFCAMRLQALVTFPQWIPDFVIQWTLDFNAGALTQSVREGLIAQAPWPKSRSAPIKTDKGQRDRHAWQLAQRANLKTSRNQLRPVAAPPRPTSTDAGLDLHVADGGR